MPLHLLLPIVVLGILGVALLLHLLGKSERIEIVDVDQVRDLWHHQYPNAMVLAVEIADGGHQAMVQTSDGPGVVWAMGADVACRLVGDAGVSEHSKGLKIRLGDYSAPIVRIKLSDPKTRQHWLATLTGA